MAWDGTLTLEIAAEFGALTPTYYEIVDVARERDRDRKWREAALAKMCEQDGCSNPKRRSPGAKLCERHHEDALARQARLSRERNDRRRAKNTASGLCRCGNDLAPRRRSCDSCLTRQRERDRTRRDRAKREQLAKRYPWIYKD